MAENEILNSENDSQLTSNPVAEKRKEEDVEKDYQLLKQFGVKKPENGDLVDKAVKELGGVLGRIELPTGKVIKRTQTGGYTDGDIFVEYGQDGKLVKIDNDGTTYDEDGNVLIPGQPKDE